MGFFPTDLDNYEFFVEQKKCGKEIMYRYLLCYVNCHLPKYVNETEIQEHSHEQTEMRTTPLKSISVNSIH